MIVHLMMLSFSLYMLYQTRDTTEMTPEVGFSLTMVAVSLTTLFGIDRMLIYILFFVTGGLRVGQILSEHKGINLITPTTNVVICLAYVLRTMPYQYWSI